MRAAELVLSVSAATQADVLRRYGREKLSQLEQVSARFDPDANVEVLRFQDG